MTHRNPLPCMALGLVFAAAPLFASAAIAPPSGGDGELLLAVWDQTAGQSYTRDLGMLLSDFGPAAFTDPGFSLVWAPDAQFTSFLTASGTNPLVWGVLGGHDKGSGAGSRALATTLDPDPIVTEAQIELLRTYTLNGALHLFDYYAGALNKLPTHNQDLNGDGMQDTLDNGSSVVGSGAAYAGSSSYQQLLATLYGSFGLTGLGDSQNFWYVANGRSPRSPVDATAYGIVANGEFLHSTFTLTDDGTLVFAVPVPEAETWALLLVGLSGVAWVARRRRQAAGAPLSSAATSM